MSQPQDVSTRPGVLALLERELRTAERTGEFVQAARLRARIAVLSAGTGVHPARETTRSTR